MRPSVFNVVLGNQYPLATTAAKGGAGSPVRELTVVYPNASRKPVFWQPFGAMESDGNGALIRWLAALDIGWLGIYLLTYLPVLFILQALMKVA